MGIEELARKLAEEQQKLPEIVEQQVPPRYRPFICWLDQNKQLSQRQMAVSPELKALGVYSTDRGTYIALRVPYMAVDGRMLWFADLHREAKAKYSISSNIEALAELLKNGDKAPTHYPLVVWIDSEIFGRLEGVSRIFWDGSGASRTNPLETAYTSALGRAIAQAGIGLIGTGIASAEEVEAAQAAQQAAEAPAPSKAERPAPVKSAAATAPTAPPAPAAAPDKARVAAPLAQGGRARPAAKAEPAPGEDTAANAEVPAPGAPTTAPGIFWVKGHLPQKAKDGKVSFQVVLRQEDGREFTVLAEEPAVISGLMKALREKTAVKPVFAAGPGGMVLVTGLEQVVA